MDVTKNVMKSGANDVPNNGGILRVLLKRKSYCHKIDKKVKI
jgi:hypothetical protein